MTLDGGPCSTVIFLPIPFVFTCSLGLANWLGMAGIFSMCHVNKNPDHVNHALTGSLKSTNASGWCSW